MIKYLIFDRGDTIIVDLPEEYGGMKDWPYYKTVDGVKETLPDLYKQYTCIIASNTSVSSIQVIRFALKKLQINSYFKYIFTQNELGYAKPNTKFFTNLFKFINISASETCMIGNSYRLDITPAKELGLKTILLTSKSGEFPNADYITNNFKDIPKLLDKLNNSLK